MGADTMLGGAGHDTIDYTDDTQGVVVNLGTSTASGGTAQGDIISGFESIWAGSGNDHLTLSNTSGLAWGGAGNDTILGGAGNDSLYGGDGADRLTGGAGNDYIDGGAGDDTIQGGAGADTMIGGTGHDTLDYTDDTQGITVNIGNNTASGGLAQGDVISGFENIRAGSGNDHLTMSNTSGSIELRHYKLTEVNPKI